MTRIIAGLLLGTTLFLSESAEAGWRYTSYYRTGATYWGAGYHNNYYYAPGYWTYDPPAPVIASFIQYVPTPTVFATYQPAALVALPNYQASSLTSVANVQQVQTQQATTVQQTTQRSAFSYSECHQQLQALEVRMKAMELVIGGATQAKAQQPSQAKQEYAPMPPAVEAKATSGLSVLVNRCGGCHDKAQAEAKGGKVVLLDGGNMVQLSKGDLWDVTRQLLSGKMPPPKSGVQLADGEGALLMQYLDSLTPKKE